MTCPVQIISQPSKGTDVSEEIQSHQGRAGHSSWDRRGLCGSKTSGLHPWVSRRLWFRTSRAEKGPEEEVVAPVLARTLMAFSKLLCSCGPEGLSVLFFREIA